MWWDVLFIESDKVPVTICLGTSSRSSRLSMSCSQAPVVDRAAVRQMGHCTQEMDASQLAGTSSDTAAQGKQLDQHHGAPVASVLPLS